MGGVFGFRLLTSSDCVIGVSLRSDGACFVEGRRPGCAPGGAPTFFLRKKKVGKEIAPRCLRPFASLRATCDARIWGGAAELATFFELRSNSCGKLDDEACVSFGTHAHPSSCASRRSQKGWERGQTRLLLRSCAWGRFALCAADMWGAGALANRAQRRTTGRAKQWPVWSPLPPPSDRAEKRRAWVSACRRTRASSSGSPKLFDRSCLAEAAQGVHRRPPQIRASQVARSEAEGRRLGAAFSLVTFSWRPKRKLLRRRAHIPASAPQTGKTPKKDKKISPATEPKSTKPATASTPPPTATPSQQHCANAPPQAPAQGSSRYPPCPHRSPAPAAYAAPTVP